MVKVVGIIQARMSSSRLPAKVMLKLNNKTILEQVVQQVQKASTINEIIIATSLEAEDEIIEDLANQICVKCVKGSLHNVFLRFKKAILESEADIIVRITADNPLTNPKLIDEAVLKLQEKNCDYVSFKNVPIGTAVEAFKAKSFLEIDENLLNEHNVEHVTSYFYQNTNLFKVYFVEDFYKENLSHISFTVDTLEDYINIYNYFLKNEEL